MKAVGYFDPLDINNPKSLVDLEIDKPELKNPNDLLVQIRAVSVNPVDYKIRSSSRPQNGLPKILGWDASGTVIAIGTGVSRFKVGDDVYYAGEITRQGSNAEFQLVDERIVSHKPKSLSYEEAASLPLTSLTAFEALFDRLEIQRNNIQETVLIIGAAGGVGSIAIQLIKALTNHIVVATASRAEPKAWCQKMGADFIIDHSQNLSNQLKTLGLNDVKYVLSLNQTETYLTQIADIISPQGKFCLIDDPASLDVSLLKRKSVSIHWELMFTRSLFQTMDLQRQAQILNEVAQLVDTKKLISTAVRSMGVMNAENLKKAHRILESGQATGKLTLNAE